jgi:methionyl-tRNA synthetase
MEVTKLEKIVVTSGLPYANAEVHLGGVCSTYLPADILARFFKLKGSEVVFVCATDDFGTPILVEAEKKGKSPEEFVAYWNQIDRRDFNDLGISFDIFYKTSSEENIELTQLFFKELHKKGYIFKKLVWQSYCEKCKKVLPDRYVKGTCPYCGALEQYSDSCENCGKTFQHGEVKDPHCAICGSTPTKKQSEHYFFKLSNFSNDLKKWLEENENLQSEVKNYVLSWIKEGLQDWDITRDLSWGVPIPLEDAKGKVLYGWFDNHLCYISTLLKYLEEKNLDGKAFWNSSVIYHFIGKDIVYHHYLFLPAMRLGEGEFALPHFIPTRGFLLLQGQKFSKSRGWYISLRDFLKLLPADYLRYYLTSITTYSPSDVNFDWEEFQARINNELIANIGNFIHRTLTFIWARRNGRVPPAKTFDELDEEFKGKIAKVANDVAEEIGKIELSRGLKRILEFSTFCNQYFQKRQPWKGGEKADTCLYLCINAVRVLCILLNPYLPFSAGELWRQLNLKGEVDGQRWDAASELAIKSGHVINEPRILFTKVDDAVIGKEKAKLAKLETR